MHVCETGNEYFEGATKKLNTRMFIVEVKCGGDRVSKTLTQTLTRHTGGGESVEKGFG